MNVNVPSSKRKDIQNERQLLGYDFSGNSKPEQAVAPVQRNQLIKLVRALAEDGDPAFYTEFRLLYPNFSAKLLMLAPSLVQSEMVLCAFYRLGYTTKEIAYYMKTTDRSVESRKYRIRKKLKLKRKQSFPIFLQNL